MTRGWRNPDPAIALLIEKYAPDLLQAGDRDLARAVRGADAILRDGRDVDLADELLEEKLAAYLLEEQCRCRP